MAPVPLGLAPPLKVADVVLRGLRACGRYDGQVLRTTLQFTFHNPTAQRMWVCHTFAIPPRATLGAWQAPDTLEASLAQDTRYAVAGVYHLRLRSLLPGETVLVEVAWAQELTPESGRARLVIPSTVAPYCGARLDCGTQIHLFHWDFKPAPKEWLEGYRFDLLLHLEGPAARARVGSASHAISVGPADGALDVRLLAPAWMDRDAVILLDDIPQPDAAPAAQRDRPLKLIILLDISGSMRDHLGQAQTALLHLVDVLQQGAVTDGEASLESLWLHRFDETLMPVMRARADQPRQLTALREAVLSSQSGSRGTALLEALAELAQRAEASTAPHDVLLISEGHEVPGVRQWLAAFPADRTAYPLRIHALGLGRAPSADILQALCHVTGGYCEFVTPNENAAAAIARLAHRIRTAPPNAVSDTGCLSGAPYSQQIPARCPPNTAIGPAPEIFHKTAQLLAHSQSGSGWDTHQALPAQVGESWGETEESLLWRIKQYRLRHPTPAFLRRPRRVEVS
ncbi:hypothetical protein [Amphibiibacter pelophylacis]|uniref:Uncharacterized protein n=1 Tax=Amphibiibacter pelophylacis TaxID=1799477 RepID=A0ACC6NY43_9BURK